jgi:dolichol-phosphate mannosyltransferase
MSYGLLGGVGLSLHLLTLAVFHRWMDVGFAEAQGVAIFVAMTSNFFLNNLLTYREMRFRGWSIFSGLCGFYFLCTIGAATNFGISTLLFDKAVPWFLSGLAGAVVGALWNFSLSKTLLWKRNN